VGTLVLVAALVVAAGGPAVAAVRRRSTIDPRVQQAAAEAVTVSSLPVDLVAIRASTGDVLAFVSRGPGLRPDDALVGRYPTGSTFKIVTAAALLAGGLSPTSAASCPGSVLVGGGAVTTFDGHADPSVRTLNDAFAHSCNTAFAALADRIAASGFKRTAGQLGLGLAVHLGRAAFGGLVATPRSAYERAVLASDGGASVASPLALATVAATVDSGRFHPARLRTRTTTQVASRRLDPNVVARLRSMMAAAVTNGTASGQGLPPGTYAKTGTAEFTNAPAPRTVYAWLIGYRADIAFAVLVVGGSQGGPVAGPVAAAFLDALR
jgi:cell division protein FtsI/penicillin-binding protein 2